MVTSDPESELIPISSQPASCRCVSSTPRSERRTVRGTRPGVQPLPAEGAECVYKGTDSGFSHQLLTRWNTVSVSVVPGRTERGRPPDVIGRIRRPAHLGEFFAVVVIRGALARKTMSGPPVQQSAAIGKPAACRMKPLKYSLLDRLTTAWLTTEPLHGHDQDEKQGSDPLMRSHRGVSPLCSLAAIAEPRTYRDCGSGFGAGKAS